MTDKVRVTEVLCWRWKSRKQPLEQYEQVILSKSIGHGCSSLHMMHGWLDTWEEKELQLDYERDSGGQVLRKMSQSIAEHVEDVS